jgi:aminoglycoside 3-N-acetyltransferase
MTQREVADYRAAMLPFERDSTPCPTMGVFAECVRTAPGAVRSGHPQSSFAALGQRAAELLGDHDPHCHLGERSPLAALYGAHADVLLFRVGFQVCSAFHLAQYRRNGPASLRTYRCVVERKGNWVSYEDVAMDDSDFPAIGAALPRRLVAEGQVADKPVRLFGMRGGVDHAKAYMAEYQS